nr:RHS repeat-associated core domain-containing protein [Maliibacterium massiliense]
MYQLVREDNQEAGKTWVWTYDLGGNIKSRVEYSYTTGAVSVENALDTVVYAYGDANWPDKLTGYDGQAITRDAIGNPMSDGEWTYSWEGGRRLSGMSKAGTSLSYAYDASGIRTSKTVNGVKTRYTLMGSLVAYEQTGSEVIYYYYDAVGRPMSMRIGSAQYHYVYNLQGDVIGLVDNTGAVVVEYTYDAWGKPLSVTGSLAGTVGKKNPYRYRGYRYDEETGFYYLQSRYYDPEMGRFINADRFFDTEVGTHRQNMFAYCDSNPVNYKDDTGTAQTGAVPTGIPWIDTIQVAVMIVMGVYNYYANQRAQQVIRNATAAYSPSIVQEKPIVQGRTRTKKNTHIHHIVAKKARLAQPARNVLVSVGIDYKKDPRNLVILPAKYHQRMHTKEYYEYVNARIRPYKGQSAEVERVLLELQGELLSKAMASGW